MLEFTGQLWSRLNEGGKQRQGEFSKRRSSGAQEASKTFEKTRGTTHKQSEASSSRATRTVKKTGARELQELTEEEVRSQAKSQEQENSQDSAVDTTTGAFEDLLLGSWQSVDSSDITGAGASGTTAAGSTVGAETKESPQQVGALEEVEEASRRRSWKTGYTMTARELSAVDTTTGALLEPIAKNLLLENWRSVWYS